MSTINTTPTAASIKQTCDAVTQHLRWEYTAAHRNRQQQPGIPPTNNHADQVACLHLRDALPTILANYLPGIKLIEWVDTYPTIIDSTWTIGSAYIEIYWDYHPDWTLGDPSALTIQTTPTNNWPETEAS